LHDAGKLPASATLAWWLRGAVLVTTRSVSDRSPQLCRVTA